MEARIPFSGFYGSIWSDELDNEENSYVENLATERQVSQSDIHDYLWRHANYHAAYKEIAKDYTRFFESYINEKYDLRISLTFKELTSPREYNFETDKIFVEVSYKNVLNLARKVGRNKLRKCAKEMFTSRDGFISFYRSDISTWDRMRGWDYNQLFCLFTAAVMDDEDFEWGIFEEAFSHGTMTSALDAALPSVEDLFFEVGRLAGRAELKEELESEDGGDGRCFPVAYKDTKDYVKRYEEMNKTVYERT